MNRPAGRDIRLARTPADFDAAAQLIDIMQAWDAAETEALGLRTDTLLDEIYRHTPASFAAKFTAPRSAMLVARVDGEPAGCIGFSPAAGDMAEIQKLFVHPAHRGRGIARDLMTQALTGTSSQGFATTVLETASFMTDAISLYERFGFIRCTPFRAPIPELAVISVFMRRDP